MSKDKSDSKIEKPAEEVQKEGEGKHAQQVGQKPKATTTTTYPNEFEEFGSFRPRGR